MSQVFSSIERILCGDRTPWYAAAGIFFLAFAFILYPNRLTSNEEAYFGLAHHFFAPQEFSPYSAIFDHSKHLFLFHSIVGGLISLIGYDATMILMRLSQALLYGTALAFLVRTMRITVVETLGVLAVYIFIQHRLPGGSWLFHSVEGKTIAYGAILFTVAAALNGRRVAVVVLSVVATYFHFQVGGFWALVCVGLYAIVHKAHRQAVRMTAMYALAVAPLAALIAYQQLIELGTTGSNNAAVEYFAFVRIPHHIGPFLPAQIRTWAHRLIVFSLIAFTAFYVARNLPQSDRDNAKSIARTLEFVFAYVVLAFAISWFDRNSGVFAKFILFRPVAMATFLSMLVIASLLQAHRQLLLFLGSRVGTMLSAGFAIILFVIVLRLSLHEFGLPGRYSDNGLVAAVRQRTAPGDLVVIEKVGDEDTSLPRRLGRPTLVHWTFVPASPSDLEEWYDRIKWREQLFETGCAAEVLRRFPVRYVLILRPETAARLQNCGNALWSNGEQTLVKIRSRDE